MSINYTQYVDELARLAVVASTDADFLGNLAAAIDYAEQRLYRELNLLATVVPDSSATATANSRNFTLPTSQGRFVAVNGVNVVSPSGASVSNGDRNALQKTTREMIDFCWPSNTAAANDTVPSYFAMITDQQIIFGPPPGAAFTVEVIGTVRPTPLSSGNPTTFLTLYLPDLFLAASMVQVSGYLKNYGAQSDDPKMAVSWESQYQTLFASANAEEVRKRFATVMGA